MRNVKLFEEYYTNPYNPDEMWDTSEIVIDDMDDKFINDYLDSLVDKTIEFYTNNYGDKKKIGPVKLDYWTIDLPENGDYPGYHFFINEKRYGEAKKNIDYFDIDTSETIKIINDEDLMDELGLDL